MLLTIDIGTTNFKSALWDYDGNRLAFAAMPLSISISDGAKHEADPSLWFSAFEQCCRKLGNLKSVEAIVISGNGPTLVPVTEEPKSADLLVPNQARCHSARLWLDRRAEKYQDEVSAVMGGFVDASFFLPKIVGIKNDEIELYNKTRFFLGCPEYLAYKLTGQAKNVFPSDGFDRWFWNDDVLKTLNLDAEKFPAFIRPGDQFGIITSQIAEHFGFAKNIPVISGGPDFFAAILGSGVSEPGEALDRTGSSEGINLCTLNHVQDKRLMSYAHPIKPFWNVSGIINTSGKAIEWGCKVLGIDSFDDFIALAKTSKKGSGGLVFSPYLAGGRSPVPSRSVSACWEGISLACGREDFANSILEGIAFAIKDVLAVMQEKGEKAKHLRVTGGLADCVYLNQMKADICGLEVLEGAHKEAELLGLAIIGSCFMEKYASYKEASSVLYRVKKRYAPI
ncbi:MAG: FGGY-family carbohydrate kinase [Treponema sp.]|jgi:xylulokinase|nr:FGGY-family carbohydrate kinase [Treponema sp.]